ncbi:MAG TPA: Asp/Glu/hydantoin racemase [Burkholderiales bacterium]|nr:Asp/Glu/hydantoin racemase [Burkholderiales bacterium]
MPDRVRLGILTPSSNTVLEPLTSALLAGIPGASAHFSRFRVTEISLGREALGQFELAPILDAARLLADAKVQAIGWSGTSAGWLGLERDEALCAAITKATGIPACTSTLALRELMRANGRRTLGLVSPYVDAVQARIVENFARHGMPVVAERHSGISVNWDFCLVGEPELTRMVAEVAADKPDAIAVFCTNLAAAQLASRWERDYHLAVYDSVATVLWKCLALAGAAPQRIKGWGGLFQTPAP